MDKKIKRILISIITIIVLIVALITVTRRGKGKDIKDEIIDVSVKVKNVANETANVVTDNVSKGIKGASKVLNNVSSFIESNCFFEKEKTQSIASSLLIILTIIFIYFVSLKERLNSVALKPYKVLSFEEIFSARTIIDIIFTVLITLAIEIIILIVFFVGGLITIKNDDLSKIIKRVFKSRFYFRRPLKITIIRIVSYLVIVSICFIAFKAGIIYTFGGGHCSKDGSTYLECFKEISVII